MNIAASTAPQPEPSSDFDGSVEEFDFDYASAIAGVARDLMVRHDVPPTPDNFSVWFRYVRGIDPEFKKTVDTVISNRRPFDRAINAALVRMVRHLESKNDSAGHRVMAQLHTLIGKTTSYVAVASTDSRTHADHLDRVASDLRAGLDPARIIGALTAELHRASERATMLEARFAAASKELEQVRASLVAAERTSLVDPLTGLANRRGLDDNLRMAQLHAMEVGAPLSIMMIDVDHFKRFNDNFGHQLGDHVLRLIAGVLSKSIRPEDVAARYGGEEMTAVLPGANRAAARDIAERVRTAIADRQIVRRATGEVLCKVTVSIGVAEFVFGESAASLLERGDRALYAAKRAGRNRTCTDDMLDGGVEDGAVSIEGA